MDQTDLIRLTQTYETLYGGAELAMLRDQLTQIRPQLRTRVLALVDESNLQQPPTLRIGPEFQWRGSFSETEYDAFFATYSTVGVKTDYVMGNHEAVGPNGRAVYYSRVHPQPAYYTVSDGPFHVIVLNTNEPGMSKHIGFYGIGDSRNSVQADWLVRQLRAITNRRAWIIVALHHPLLDPETDDPFATTSRAERDALVRLFHAYGVDLVVQGDTHFYRRHLRADGSNYVTEGMAGAPPVPASTTPIDSHDVKTLGATGSSPIYGYVTVTRSTTGTITGRMFWMKSSDSWTRHLGDRWTLRQVVRTAP